MEATGVYWIALYELLERQGFTVFLVDPRQTKHAPGRPKSDVLDCQMIQRLHSYGLLTASFRPAMTWWSGAAISVSGKPGSLRRPTRSAHAEDHGRKNVKLTEVVSDIVA